MKWTRSESASFLDDGQSPILSVIRTDGVDGCHYRIDYYCINECEEIDGPSLEYAEWQAVLHLGNRCNAEANYYHRIRDKLPSVHDLAERALVI